MCKVFEMKVKKYKTVKGSLTLLKKNTVKPFLFARTLFSRKFARAERRKNKVLANNSLYKGYIRRYGKSRK